MLIMGQQVLGVVEVPASFSGLPNVLIDIVMASLVFGVSFNKFVSSYIAPVLIYSVVMVAVTIPAILFTAKRFCHHEWFEKAVMAFGAATGNTSTGLALVRAVDPDSKSSAGDTHGVYTTLTSWKDAFTGLCPVWLMSGVALTMGVGLAIAIGFLIFGFVFFDQKRKAKCHD